MGNDKERHWFGHVPLLEAGAATSSLAVAILLVLLKFAAYFLTGSTAIFSDAMESIVNVLASGVALYALTVAHRPADVDHPYGHGKIEFLSAAFEGGMVLLAAVVIAYQAISVLIRGRFELAHLGTGIWLMAAAAVINGGFGLWLMNLGKRRASLLLAADGTHLASDAITSVAALVALAIVHATGWQYADPIVAMLVAGYIISMAIGVLRKSAAGLMDQQDLGDERTINQILDRHVGATGISPRICSYHKVRHRHSGRYHWVDFHIMVPASLNVRQGHQIASALEHEIEQAVREGKATAHVEPCDDPQCGGACRDT